MGAAASQLRRTASSGRPVTPTLDGWGEAPVRSPRSSVTAMSSDASASPPPSLHAECAALRDASLSDGGEMSDSVSLESLREQLRRMQLRLAESERCATSLSHEVGNINEQFATTLAHLQNEHAQEMQSLESSLRAEVRGSPVGLPRVYQPPAPRCGSLFRLRARRTQYRAPPPRLRHRRTGRRAPGAVRRGAAAALVNRATLALSPRSPLTAPRPSQAQDALDAAASELEAAAMERAHLWSLLRDSGKESALPPGAAQQGRRASTGHVTSTARVAAWATP